MRPFTAISGRAGRIGLALAALVSIAALSHPASANGHRRHHHHSGAFFSFGFASPGYYYGPPRYYYGPTRYYYAPPPAYYYYPPPAYYYYPPPAYYYGPGASFNLIVPFGHRHH